MTRHNRTLSVVSIMALLIGLLVSIVDPIIHARAQDVETAARPEGFPAEAALESQFFLFDRQVPVAPESLLQMGTQGELTFFAESEVAPFSRLFVAAPQQETLARYLPEIPVGPDGTPAVTNECLAEPQEYGELPTSEGTYAFAGSEGDIPIDDLSPFATTAEGFTIFAASPQQPPAELLLDTGADLVRFVLVDEDGRPPMLGETLPFQGENFVFAGDVAGTVDPATLAPVGCAGPFRLSAPQSQVDAGVLDEVYVTVGARLLAYRAEPAAQTEVAADATPPAESSPTEAPLTEEPVADAAATPPASGANLIPVETPAEGVVAETEEPTATPAATVDETPTAVVTTEPAAETPAAEESPATPAPVVEDTPAATEAGDTPLEIDIAGAFFALDRSVPFEPQGLEQISEADGPLIFAPAGGPPYARVYGVADASGERLGRYLAEVPIGPDGTPSPAAACVAEAANFALVDVGGLQYAYAGPEPDLSPDRLQPVLQTGDGQPVYAETTEEPFPELFFTSDGALDRFVLLDDQGVPTSLGEQIAFAGQRFRFDRDATLDIDPDTLLRAGCVGPFSARIAPEADPANLDQVFVVLIGETPRVLAYVRADAVAPSPTPAETPTEAPIPPIAPASPTATLAPPTETPVPPTATAIIPTATPVPPTATPVPPTETPLPPTATTIPPTATPVPPTETPAPTPTPTPAPPTEVPLFPTETPTPTPAPASPTPAIATEIPVTEAPVGTPLPVTATPAPPSDATPTPLILPTVAPPAAPISDIPLDAPPPIPADLPREIQVQGIRYSFDLEVDVDPALLVPIDVVQAPGTTLEIFASPDDQVSSTRLSYMMQQPISGPFARVYAVVVSTGIMARYVSEAPITPAGVIDIAAPCSAEANPRTFSYTFGDQQYAYTFASVEVNISVEELRTTTIAALGSIPLADDGREILVRAAGYPGLAEVFLASGDQLERYVALNAVGLPVTMTDLVFAETRFRYEAQVSVTVTETGFRRIGCSGPFPLFAPIAQAEALAPLAISFTLIDNRVYQFIATEIVIAPTGQTPPPPPIVPPPPGFVQITLQTTVIVGPTPTPLPNIRIVPLPAPAGLTPTPTPASGLEAQRPVRPVRCQGDPGAIGANGLPERLPSRIQLSGVAYSFVASEQADNDVTLTPIGCVGPFAAFQSSGARVIYLRAGQGSDTLYRYEATSSFTVDFTVTGDPRVITSGDQRYVLRETWQRSIYSSVTVIVYAQEPEAVDPPRVFAVPVDGDVIAEYIPEAGDVVEPPSELRTRAEEAGINPDLVLGGGRRYLLVDLWSPIGTTTNGWVTLYATTGDVGADTLLATDPRSLDLLVYRRSGAAGE